MSELKFTLEYIWLNTLKYVRNMESTCESMTEENMNIHR